MSTTPTKQSIRDYETLSEVGKGSFGKVIKAVFKRTREEVAIKVVEKALLKKEAKTKQALREKALMAKLKTHPGVVRLMSTFQDEERLYFVMEYCPNGTLDEFLQRYGILSLQQARFFAAEIVSVLEYLHSLGIAHRDLKPNNLLISISGRLKLTDFGTAKEMTETDRRSTLVGTIEYMAPELITMQVSSPASDLWALGIILYQMLVGSTPFRHPEDGMMFANISSLNYQMPGDVDPLAVDLITKLLTKDPGQRLGTGPPGSGNDYEALKTHPFFAGLDVDLIYTLPVPGEHIETLSIPESYLVPPSPGLPPEERLIDSGSVLYSGLVKKKAGWIFRKRHLVLTSSNTLQYYDKTIKKGEIPLRAGVQVLHKENKDFWVVTPSRTYYFKVIAT